jgi:hypothetical protein
LLLGAGYQLFHFDRYSLQSQFLVFPGLSDFGRVRFTTSDTFSVKLSKNFRLNLRFGTTSTVGRRSARKKTPQV